MTILVDLLPGHKASLRLTHNEHRTYYQKPADWIAEQEAGGNCWFEWVSAEERARAIDTDSIWTLHWYPDTPVGFHALAASSLDVLLAAVRSA